MRELLNLDQIVAYDRLRGYTGDRNAWLGAHGHLH
jgi:hypothetical protein